MNRFYILPISIFILINANLAFGTSVNTSVNWVWSIALSDTIPPTITCPPNDTITLPSGACDTIYTYTVTAMDSLMVLTPSQLSGLASGEAFPIGLTGNTFIATDTAGNTATCSFEVLVLPASDTLLCRVDTVDLFLDTGCSVSLNAEAMLLTPYGCLNDFAPEYDTEPPFGNGPWAPAVFGDPQRGKVLGIRIRSLSTGERCFGFVEVRDTTPPALTCPEINLPCVVPTAHLSPPFLTDSLGIAEGQPTALENCPGTISFGHVDVQLDIPCDSPGNVTHKITRFWTALDASNNVSTCVQTINRVRALDDVLFPDDVTVSCAQDTLPVTTGAPYFQLGQYQYSLLNAPFCEIAATYTDSIESLCGGSRLLHRRWRVRDACLPDTVANSMFGMQRIEVQDDVQPTVHCPTDTIIQYSLTDCQDTIDLPDIIVSDACSYVISVFAYWNIGGMPDTVAATLGDFPGNNPGASDTLAIFGLGANFPVGSTDIRYLATDACGNTASCEMQLIVWDSIPPLAVCDSFQVAYLDELGQASLPAGLANNGSSDACTDVFFKIKRQTPGSCDSLGNAFDDLINFCCADLDDTLQLILRVYDIPVPIGPMADNFAQGQYSDCTLPLLVLDTNEPQCEAPADTVVLCAEFDASLGSYGQPLYSCRVDSVAVLLDYQQFDTLCNQGMITRTYRVFDAVGASGQCTQKITVENQQHYFIRFPDDLYVTMCDTSGNYGEPELFGLECELMDVSYTDTMIVGVPDACFEIQRRWRILNGCTHDPAQDLVPVPNPEPHPLSIHSTNLPGPVVSEFGTPAPWAPTRVILTPNASDTTDFSNYWDANANGYAYTQIIKVIDIDPPEFANCSNNTTVFVDSSLNDFFLWNANYSPDPDNPKQDLCEGAVDLSVTITDACFGADLGVDFILFLDIDGDDIQETEVNSNDLPTAGSVQYFNIGNPGNPTGLGRTYDHRPVLPNEKYQFVLEFSENGRNRIAHLRWNSAAAPTDYQLPQLPLGNHSIRWTVYDGCGNENSCQMNFRVEDPDGTCTPAEVIVGGTIKTEAGDGIANVAIQLDGTHVNLPAFQQFDLTDDQGKYNFSIPTNASYTITPFRDDNHLNGVSTFDLLLINKHVLGLQSLGSPYKIIAADANKSNSVTTFDIVELRKLVLGTYQELPNNTSWRFVPVGFSFANPDNPFQGGFPEIQQHANLQQNNLPMHDFIGIKIGDMNGNAIPDIAGDVPDDRSGPTVFFEISDQELEPGATVQATIRAAEAVSGFQFTLNYPGLELLDIEPGAGLSAENFGVFPSENTLTASWDGSGQPEFTLHFRALQAGRLSDQLQLSNRIARSEAYSTELEIRSLALHFGEAGIKKPAFELYQNQPNPFGNATEIGFYLPEAKTATLRVWDVQGRLLFSETKAYAPGQHSVLLDASALPSGLLYYELVTDMERAVRKMVRE